MDSNSLAALEPLIFSHYSMTDGVPVSMLFSMATSSLSALPHATGSCWISVNVRFWQLAERPDYPQIRNQLVRFVHATIPSPLQTAGMLWTLTALPSTVKTTDHRRLFTLNVNNVEALFVAKYDMEDGGAELEWVVNAWPWP